MMVQDVSKENTSFVEYDTVNLSMGKPASLKKMDLYKTFWIFNIDSVAGFVVETIWCLFKNGRIESRSSMIIGPFTAVYGLGALVLYLGKHFAIENNKLHIFAYGATASTFVEYLCSLVQESLFGSVSWDYSRQPFNIYSSSKTLSSSVADSPLKRSANRLVVGICFRRSVLMGE